jgi:DNA-binding IscR family transcriptional regulator
MQLNEGPMSLKELAARIRIEEKQVYKVLSLLHKSSQVVHFRDVDSVRRYRLSEVSS